MDHIRLVTTLPATPKEVYDTWLSSQGHTAMTGGAPATTEARVGARHTAWDGYISGQHVELEPGKRILQTWRTTEFPETAPDSLLEIILVRDASGTRLTLIQSGIPDGQGETYHEGWQDHYFAPMRAHFEIATPKAGPAKAAGTKKATKKKAKKKAKKKPSSARAKASASSVKKPGPAKTTARKAKVRR